MDGPPATMADFVEASRKIAALGGGKTGYCLRGGPGATNGYIMFMLTQMGSNEFYIVEPHANLGVDLNATDVSQTAARYGVGVDVDVHPRVNLSLALSRPQPVRGHRRERRTPSSHTCAADRSCRSRCSGSTSVARTRPTWPSASARCVAQRDGVRERHLRAERRGAAERHRHSRRAASKARSNYSPRAAASRRAPMGAAARTSPPRRGRRYSSASARTRTAAASRLPTSIVVTGLFFHACARSLMRAGEPQSEISSAKLVGHRGGGLGALAVEEEVLDLVGLVARSRSASPGSGGSSAPWRPCRRCRRRACT